jgi:hypothetical protein
MRFIIGFIFFGLLFYAIWFYFPEAFQTLVAWAAKFFEFIRHLVENVTEKVSSTTSHGAPAIPPKP